MYHKPEQSQWNNGWFANDLSWLNNPRAMHFSLWKPHRMRMECKGKVSSSSSGRKDGMAGLVCCSMESSHHLIPLNKNPTFRKCHTVHNCCPKLCCSCCAWVRTISSRVLPTQHHQDDDNCLWLFASQLQRPDTILHHSVQNVNKCNCSAGFNFTLNCRLSSCVGGWMLVGCQGWSPWMDEKTQK